MPMTALFSQLCLTRHRSDEMLETFCELVKHEAEDKCNPPILPREKKLPRRLNNNEDGHSFGSVHELYRKEYFEIIGSLVGDLKKRFKQKNFIFVQKLETLLLDSANGRPFTLPKEIIEMYEKMKKDINMQELKLHVQLLPDTIKSMPLDEMKEELVISENTD